MRNSHLSFVLLSELAATMLPMHLITYDTRMTRYIKTIAPSIYIFQKILLRGFGGFGCFASNLRLCSALSALDVTCARWLIFFEGPGGSRACFSARLGAPELNLRASIFDRFVWYVEFVKIVVSPRRNHYFSCLEPPKITPKLS